MRAKLNQFETLLLTVIMLTLFFGSFAHADDIYVSCNNSPIDGTIVKLDSGGNGSVFATGLNSPIDVAFDSSGNLYAVNSGNGTIIKFDSMGNSSIFASGLINPTFIAVIPEPASIILLSLGGLALFGRKRI